MENIENDFPIKRFGKVAIDIIAFAALAVILVTIMSIPFSVLFLKTDKESPDSMFVFMLSETLMLIGVFLSAWIVWHFRGLSLAGLGRSLAMRRKDLLSGVLLAIVLYAVGFGISLLAGAVEITGVTFNPSSLLISFVFFLLVAVTEELALRGFVLERMLQGGINKFWALFFFLRSVLTDSYRQSELQLPVLYQYSAGRCRFWVLPIYIPATSAFR